jgi:hypothetical protein
MFTLNNLILPLIKLCRNLCCLQNDSRVGNAFLHSTVAGFAHCSRLHSTVRMLFRSPHVKVGSPTHWCYFIWCCTLCIRGIVFVIVHILCHHARALNVEVASFRHVCFRFNACRSEMGRSCGCIPIYNLRFAVCCGTISSICVSQHSCFVALALWFGRLFHSVRRLVLRISESTLHCRASYLFGVMHSSTHKRLLLVRITAFRNVPRFSVTDPCISPFRLLLGWVVCNLTITAARTNAWYVEKFGDDYSRLHRYVIIPFVY